mmetsp:Transcript_26118/g.64524  ORF Transcript_26118/g.64524 Transcript_26118/m.64524 type:complete len:231 (+) Transcript_26118:1298-1990(+)
MRRRVPSSVGDLRGKILPSRSQETTTPSSGSETESKGQRTETHKPRSPPLTQEHRCLQQEALRRMFRESFADLQGGRVHEAGGTETRRRGLSGGGVPWRSSSQKRWVIGSRKGGKRRRGTFFQSGGSLLARSWAARRPNPRTHPPPSKIKIKETMPRTPMIPISTSRKCQQRFQGSGKGWGRLRKRHLALWHPSEGTGTRLKIPEPRSFVMMAGAMPRHREPAAIRNHPS